LFLLPFIRGYALYGRGWADTLAHIGHARTILSTGHISPDDWYPLIHIIMVNFEFIGISFEGTRAFFSTFFTIQYMVFMSLYFKQFQENKYLICLFVSIPLIYGYYHTAHMPAIYSFMLIPSFLFLTKKSLINKKFNILIILMAFCIVLFHPMTTLILILIIFIVYLSKYIYSKYVKTSFETKNLIRIELSLFIPFFIWYSRFPRFEMFFENVLYSMIYDNGSPVAEQQVGYTVGLTPMQILVNFIQLYGVIWIYAGIGLLFLFIVFLKIYTNEKVHFYEVLFSFQFIMGVIFGGLFFAFYFIRYDPTHISKYVIVMSTILFSFILKDNISFFTKINKKDKKVYKTKLVTIILILLILFSTVISIYGVYKEGNHLTYSEIEGTRWHLDHMDKEKETISGEMSFKFIYYLEGRNVSEEKLEIFPRSTFERFQHPDRLGYLKNETISVSIGEEAYIITKPHDYKYYKRLTEGQREHSEYYLEEDIEKLENDPTSNKLYSNGEYIIWEV